MTVPRDYSLLGYLNRIAFHQRFSQLIEAAYAVYIPAAKTNRSEGQRTVKLANTATKVLMDSLNSIKQYYRRVRGTTILFYSFLVLAGWYNFRLNK